MTGMQRMARSRILLPAMLAGLLLWSFAMAYLSHAFDYGGDVLDKPVVTFVLLLSAAGVVYLITLWCLKSMHASRRWIATIFLIGLAMRLIQFAGVPILEDDYYRYLWDGGVAAHAINPYTHAPDEARSPQGEDGDTLRRLGDEASVVLERVNHPSLRTIYPPTAQAAFVIAHWMAPYEMQGLRWTWLVLDLAVAVMLLVLLRGRVGVLWQFAIYWLNPLLIKEVFNSGHMELTVVAALLATLIAVKFRRWLMAGCTLGLAVGAKIWPILWAPLLLRCVSRARKRRLMTAVVLFATAFILLLPLLASRFDPGSGLTAYAERWQMNDSAFMVIHETTKLVTTSHAQITARSIVGLVVLAVIITCLRTGRASLDWMITAALAVTTALFLLSPTQFPWYYLWVLPLVALWPMPSLLMLTVTLPIYYLRFPLAAMGQSAWFDYGLVWIEFVPIWIMLGVEMWRIKHQRRIVSEQ